MLQIVIVCVTILGHQALKKRLSMFCCVRRTLATGWKVKMLEPSISTYAYNGLKVHIHFRKFSTERKIFRGPHAQYDFFFRSVYAP